MFPRPPPEGDKTSEMYFIDKREDSRTKLESFEQGHRERDSSMVKDLEVWPH